MEAVIFDMDGILFDTERICMESWREIGEEWGIAEMETAVIGCIGLNRTDTKLFFINHFGENFPYEEFRQRTAERMKEKLKKEGLPIKKGVKELLLYLKEKKIKIGLASSTRKEGVLNHLADANLTEYFQVIIGGDMVEHSKPQPDIYLLACKELECKAEDTFAIEDSPNGIRAGYRAGMKVIMVPDMVEPTEEIHKMLVACHESLLDVKEWMKKEYF